MYTLTVHVFCFNVCSAYLQRCYAYFHIVLFIFSYNCHICLHICYVRFMSHVSFTQVFYLFSHVLCIFSHVCPTCFQSLYVLCVFSFDCIAYPYMCCGYFHMHNTHFNRCVVHIFIFIMYISHGHCTYLHIMHIFICIMHIVPHVIHIFI